MTSLEHYFQPAASLYLKPASLQPSCKGAPLSAGQQLDQILDEKKQELQKLALRLKLMPSHDSLFLLRNVLAAPRLMYLLRSAPCTDSPVLPLYDEVLRNSLSATLNVDLDDERWRQASLPVRWGGLGVRSAVLLALSAYMALAASTIRSSLPVYCLSVNVMLWTAASNLLLLPGYD